MARKAASGIVLGLAIVAAMEATARADPADGITIDPPTVDAGRNVLLRRGGLVLDLGLQYSHSSGTEVAIEGYTVIPSLLIGLINVSEVQRDSYTASVALRYGLFNRLETEIKIPYIYREEEVREREVFGETPTDLIYSSRGHGIGDVELAFRYQLNKGLGSGPIYVANLRLKSRTGKDPFEVDRERLYVENPDGTRTFVGEVLREQPTGSGFYSVQPGLSIIYPTEPAVLFGSVSYLWNIERDVPEYGLIDPGDAVGITYGMGFGINERTSFNLAYDHHIIFKTRREDDAGVDAVFDRFQVGALLFGFSQRLGPRSSFNLSVAVGVTEHAPNVQVALRMPLVVL